MVGARRRCTALRGPQRRKRSRIQSTSRQAVTTSVLTGSSQIRASYVPRWSCISTGKEQCVECSIFWDVLDKEDDCEHPMKNIPDIPDPLINYWNLFNCAPVILSVQNMDKMID